MNRLLKGIALLGFAAGLLAFAALAGVLLEPPARAQTGDDDAATRGPAISEPDSQRLITVSGRGRVSTRPDMATVRIGVQTEADSAAEALSQNSLRMNQVNSAILEAGIAQGDIQTVGLRLTPRYDRSAERSPELIGYQVANTMAITVRDLQNLRVLLDTVVEAGGNTIEGIQFAIEDNDALRAAAREAAMADAIAKAKQLTALADAELGEVITIEEVGGVQPQPVSATAEIARSAPGSVSIQADQQTIESAIRVTWQIR